MRATPYMDTFKTTNPSVFSENLSPKLVKTLGENVDYLWTGSGSFQDLE
jgi:hypothetical protein